MFGSQCALHVASWPFFTCERTSKYPNRLFDADNCVYAASFLTSWTGDTGVRGSTSRSQHGL